MKDLASFTVQFGPILYQYDALYLLYMLVGWITVVLYAQKNFDEPTYELSPSDPPAIMAPRLVASQKQYVSGFLIYLTSMTVLYLALCLAGPTVVLPLVQGLAGAQSAAPEGTRTAASAPSPPAAHPAAATESHGGSTMPAPEEKRTPDPQWPLIIALALVGLAPRVTWLREPEMVLRRFSHRFASIPAYVRFIAFDLQRSSFDFPHFAGFSYGSLGVAYRPSADSPEIIDQQWRKLCILFRELKKFASGAQVPVSGTALDQRTRERITTETQRIAGMLIELDERLLAQPANASSIAAERERGILETELEDLLKRVYLLLACAIVASRASVATAARPLGFGDDVQPIRLGGPLAVIFAIVFGVLLSLYMLVGPLLGTADPPVMPPDFFLRCHSVFVVVVSCASATYVTLTLRDKLMQKQAWGNDTALRLVSYAKLALKGYVVAAPLLFFLNLPFNAADLASLNFLLMASLTHAGAPAAAGVLGCFWLNNPAPGPRGILIESAISAAVLSAFAALVKFLYFAQVGATLLSAATWAHIGFFAAQYFTIGLVIGVIAEVVRSYRSHIIEITPRPRTMEPPVAPVVV